MIDGSSWRRICASNDLIEGHILPAPATQLGHRDPNGDGQRPSQKPAATLELREPLEDANERVLDNVLQEFLAAACPPGKSPPQAAQSASRRSDRATCWSGPVSLRCRQPGLVVPFHDGCHRSNRLDVLRSDPTWLKSVVKMFDPTFATISPTCPSV